jgi:hypothetical protein
MTTPFCQLPIPEALQAAADRLSACIIRKQLDYWTLILDNLEMNGDSFRLKNSRKKKDPSQ